MSGGSADQSAWGTRRRIRPIGAARKIDRRPSFGQRKILVNPCRQSETSSAVASSRAISAGGVWMFKAAFRSPVESRVDFVQLPTIALNYSN